MGEKMMQDSEEHEKDARYNQESINGGCDDVEECSEVKKNGERVLRRRKSLPVIAENILKDDFTNNNNKSTNSGRSTVFIQQRRIVQRAVSNSQVQYVMIRAAISENSLIELQSLLRRKNVNIDNIEPDGLAAIHYAAMNGTRESVEILLNEGAKSNTVSKEGEYPLDIAVRCGNYEVAQFLIEKGARIDHVINGIPLEQEIRLRSRRRNRAHTIDLASQEVSYCDA